MLCVTENISSVMPKLSRHFISPRRQQYLRYTLRLSPSNLIWVLEKTTHLQIEMGSRLLT